MAGTRDSRATDGEGGMAVVLLRPPVLFFIFLRLKMVTDLNKVRCVNCDISDPLGIDIIGYQAQRSFPTEI